MPIPPLLFFSIHYLETNMSNVRFSFSGKTGVYSLKKKCTLS